MFKHKSTSGSNCFVTFILPEGALFVYQLFAEQSIILNLKQKRNPVSTEFLFRYLTEFCPSLVYHVKFMNALFWKLPILNCFGQFHVLSNRMLRQFLQNNRRQSIHILGYSKITYGIFLLYASKSRLS